MSAAPSIEPETSPFPRIRGVGSDGFVSIDVACRKCGYDLRALSVDAKCPECGTDVIGSLRGEQLSNADPGWLRRLETGSRCLFWTTLMQLTVGCISIPSRPKDASENAHIHLIAIVPWFIGVWLLSRPDPSGRGELKYGRWRRAWVVAAIVTVGVESAYTFNAILDWMPERVTWTVRLIAFAGCAICGFRYLALFAERLSDWLVRFTATFLSVSFPLCYIAVASFMVAGETPPTLLAIAGILLYAFSQVIHLKTLAQIATSLKVQQGWRYLDAMSK